MSAAMFSSAASKLFKGASPPLLQSVSYRNLATTTTSKSKTNIDAKAKAGSTKVTPKKPVPEKSKKSVPQKVYKLSPTLSSVLQVSESTRPEALKRMWDYIKANNLQNKDDKKQILCDEKLKSVFGQEKVGLTEVLKLMSPHILKLD